MSNDVEAAKKKKIPSGSISLQMAGDLILARCTNRELSQIFKRYEALLECFANMEKEERILNYKFFIALILTSHAKKLQNLEERKGLFDLKNKIYFNLANNKAYRRKLNFRYLTSKNFRVLEFCEKCTAQNTTDGTEKHKWKFCRDCNVDRKFYNVLQMTHSFPNGSMSLYLSNDQVHLVDGMKVAQKGNLEEETEEGRFDKFHYNVKNLDVFALDSVRKVFDRIMALSK